MHINGHSSGASPSYTNYVAYRDPKALGQSRIGHLDLEKSSIRPLSFASGTALSSLYQVIEIGESQIKPAGEPFPLASVELLPPISGRDILAVGKNYVEHAVEFNSSGYDASDRNDQPTHPVIFTKRSTSIIAHGESILPHPGFTETVDYEGEIGAIIGKSGFQIDEADAEDYIWGYTIINDMTARERQRDHKQFFLGKSPDTFCPMGPIAVPVTRLPKLLRVQTYVNGEERQDSTSDKLIFSVPFLIKTISEGQTIRPGDVIATGTPAGVGFGQKPPVYLKPGDVVAVAVTGLGVLKNTISEPSATNQTMSRVARETTIPISNLSRTYGGVGLTSINSKQLFYQHSGDATKPPIIFIHGLGGSSEFFTALSIAMGFEKSHSVHSLDLEGHGLSPTSAASTISISSYMQDFHALAQQQKVSGAIVIAHSMGCLVALTLAIKYPQLVSKLILFGPPPNPLSEIGQKALLGRAATARSGGMLALVDSIVEAGTSAKTKAERPLAVAAMRILVISQDPEGYAKGCTALAGVSAALTVSQINTQTLIITGNEDKVSSPQTCENYVAAIRGAKLHVLPQVGHAHIFEDLDGVTKAIRSFL